MKRRTVLAGLGALTASGTFAIGSGAFTSTAAEREVTIEVVDDPDAYMGMSYDTGVFVQLCNQFPVDVTIDSFEISDVPNGVEISYDDSDPEGETLTPGGSCVDVALDISCTEVQTEETIEITFDIEASGDDNEIEFSATREDRTVTLPQECLEEEIEIDCVDFSGGGGGNAEIQSPDTGTVDDVTIWHIPQSGSEGPLEEDGDDPIDGVPLNQKLQQEQYIPSDAAYAGIYIGGQVDRTYIHPSLEHRGGDSWRTQGTGGTDCRFCEGQAELANPESWEGDIHDCESSD